MLNGCLPACLRADKVINEYDGKEGSVLDERLFRYSPYGSAAASATGHRGDGPGSTIRGRLCMHQSSCMCIRGLVHECIRMKMERARCTPPPSGPYGSDSLL